MPRRFLTRLLGVAPLEPPSDWEEAARLVFFHHLAGLAVVRCREPGSAPLPPELAAAWEPVYRLQGLRGALLLESAARAREALGRAGIPALLYKGAGLVAQGLYPDPGVRRMDDADLVVRPGHAVAAVEALLGAGFEPVTGWTPHRVGWADAVALHDREAPAGEPLALDLHWRVGYDRLRFGEGEAGPLWEGADEAAGFPSPEAHLVLVAEHVLKHLRFKVHLAAYADLARLVPRVGDWERVGELTGRSRLAGGIRALLAAVDAEVGVPVPETARRGASARLRGELAPAALAGRVRPVEGRLRGLAHRWRMLGSPARVARDVADAAFPSGAWLRARYGRGGVAGWARYVADVARWARYRGRSPASPNQELFDPRARE